MPQWFLFFACVLCVCSVQHLHKHCCVHMNALHSLWQVAQPVQVVRDGLAQIAIALWLRGIRAHKNARLLQEVGVRQWGMPELPGPSALPTPDRLSLSSTAARRTCSSLSICSFSRSSSSCIIIRPSSGLGPALEDILGETQANFYSLEATFWPLQTEENRDYRCDMSLFYRYSGYRWGVNDLRWMIRIIITERKYHEGLSKGLKCCPLPLTKGSPPLTMIQITPPPVPVPEVEKTADVPTIFFPSNHSFTSPVIIHHSVIRRLLHFPPWALKRTLSPRCARAFEPMSRMLTWQQIVVVCRSSVFILYTYDVKYDLS